MVSEPTTPCKQKVRAKRVTNKIRKKTDWIKGSEKITQKLENINDTENTVELVVFWTLHKTHNIYQSTSAGTSKGVNKPRYQNANMNKIFEKPFTPKTQKDHLFIPPQVNTYRDSLNQILFPLNSASTLVTPRHGLEHLKLLEQFTDIIEKSGISHIYVRFRVRKLEFRVRKLDLDLKIKNLPIKLLNYAKTI